MYDGLSLRWLDAKITQENQITFFDHIEISSDLLVKFLIFMCRLNSINSYGASWS